MVEQLPEIEAAQVLQISVNGETVELDELDEAEVRMSPE
jgi:hypothetical protein